MFGHTVKNPHHQHLFDTSIRASHLLCNGFAAVLALRPGETRQEAVPDRIEVQGKNVVLERVIRGDQYLAAVKLRGARVDEC